VFSAPVGGTRSKHCDTTGEYVWTVIRLLLYWRG